MFFEYFRCLKEVNPKVSVIENVKNLKYHNNRETLKIILNYLKDCGYHSEYKVLDTSKYGVPQKRERIFIISVKEDLKEKIKLPKELENILTVRDAFADCKESEGFNYSEDIEKLYDYVGEGEAYKSISKNLMERYFPKVLKMSENGGCTGVFYRLSWNKPANMLLTSPRSFLTQRCHPEENRPLTVREYARLQTFPDDWEFEGALSSQYRQIGNAVPVNLAFHIGQSLLEILY
jgi:DNA (cytosine-5)-methyltransferase 1